MGKMMVVLDNGESREATSGESRALAAVVSLSRAVARLKTYPPIRQLQEQQAMLDRRFKALLDALDAVDEPDQELRKQIGRSLKEIHQARCQLFAREMERRDLEHSIKILETMRASQTKETP